MKSGCSFGQVSRQMITDIKEKLDEMYNHQNEQLVKVAEKLEQVEKRPNWTTSIIISILIALVTGLGVAFLRGA